MSDQWNDNLDNDTNQNIGSFSDQSSQRETEGNTIKNSSSEGNESNQTTSSYQPVYDSYDTSSEAENTFDKALDKDSTNNSFNHFSSDGGYYFEKDTQQNSQQDFGYESTQFPENSEKPKKKKGGKAKKVVAITAAGLLVLGVIGGGVYAGVSYLKDNFVLKSQMTPTSQPTAPGATLTKGEEVQNVSEAEAKNVIMDVSGVVKEVKPSVVAITNTLEYTATPNSNDPFSQFFGQQTQSKEGKAYGSGVIIGKNDKELLIVTNNHVTAANSSEEDGYSFFSYSTTSKNISVTFSDGSDADAIVKGTDEEMDLAVISVPLENIPEETMNAIKIATVGNSDECEEGNGVIAIGNALGAGSSTTVGYISALERQVTIDGYTRKLLQTDAAINPGNSGGGLFNINGQLIGINSAKYSAEEVEGVGYAIPISSAESIITDLMNQQARTKVEEAERGYLGIQGRDVPAEYINSYNFPAGASVSRITSGSPAQTAGLQIYDIITGVNNKKIESFEGLRSELDYYKAGETVELTIQRANGNTFEEKKISVTLTKQEDVQDEQQQQQQLETQP